MNIKKVGKKFIFENKDASMTFEVSLGSGSLGNFDVTGPGEYEKGGIGVITQVFEGVGSVYVCHYNGVRTGFLLSAPKGEEKKKVQDFFGEIDILIVGNISKTRELLDTMEPKICFFGYASSLSDLGGQAAMVTPIDIWSIRESDFSGENNVLYLFEEKTEEER